MSSPHTNVYDPVPLYSEKCNKAVSPNSCRYHRYVGQHLPAENANSAVICYMSCVSVSNTRLPPSRNGPPTDRPTKAVVICRSNTFSAKIITQVKQNYWVQCCSDHYSLALIRLYPSCGYFQFRTRGKSKYIVRCHCESQLLRCHRSNEFLTQYFSAHVTRISPNIGLRL